jgi:hypothetical protein
MLVLTRLLGRSTKWRIDRLRVEGGGGAEGWAELARVSAEGRVLAFSVFDSSPWVLDRAKEEDIRTMVHAGWLPGRIVEHWLDGREEEARRRAKCDRRSKV